MGLFPNQPVVLAKSSDPARNIRYPYFDNAIFNVNILGVSSILRTNTDSVSWPNGCLGYETGLAQFSVPQGMFVPGAIADSLTSFGGIIFGTNSQTNLLAFINAGAAGSYGTVAEPDADTQKFPNPAGLLLPGPRLQPGRKLLSKRQRAVSWTYGGRAFGGAFCHSRVTEQWSTNLPPGSVLSGTSCAFGAILRPLLETIPCNRLICLWTASISAR